jgi:hypothetical protein
MSRRPPLLDVEAVSQSLRKRILGLQNDEEPRARPAGDFPRDRRSTTSQCALHRLWCEGAPPRRPPRCRREGRGLVFGLPRSISS